MKVTSQMRSPTWVTPTFCPAKTWLSLTFWVLKQIRPQWGHQDRVVVKRVGEVLQPAVDAGRARVEIGGDFHP